MATSLFTSDGASLARRVSGLGISRADLRAVDGLEEVHVEGRRVGARRRELIRGVRLLNTQFGDLAEFIVRSGEVDGVGPVRGKIKVREYFEALAAGKSDV